MKRVWQSINWDSVARGFCGFLMWFVMWHCIVYVMISYAGSNVPSGKYNSPADVPPIRDLVTNVLWFVTLLSVATGGYCAASQAPRFVNAGVTAVAIFLSHLLIVLLFGFITNTVVNWILILVASTLGAASRVGVENFRHRALESSLLSQSTRK